MVQGYTDEDDASMCFDSSVDVRPICRHGGLLTQQIELASFELRREKFGLIRVAAIFNTSSVSFFYKVDVLH